MSFDLYLLPLQLSDGYDAAIPLLLALDRDDQEFAYELDAREAAQTILDMDPRYERLQADTNYRTQCEGSDAGKLWLRIHDNWVTLVGRREDGQPLAQFRFHRYHVEIEWRSGTSADELDRYVIALCGATGLAAVDPQTCSVLRLLEDGTLG